MEDKALLALRTLAAYEAKTLREILSLPKEEQAEHWEAYPEHFTALPKSAKPAVYHELCRLIPDRSTSGFHGFAGSEYAPIFHCGWADYGDSIQGVGFGFNRASFLEDEPELYYADDDMMGEVRDYMRKRIDWMLGIMDEHSSGLTVSLHEETDENGIMFRGRWEDSKKLLSFRIRFDASRVKSSMMLSNHEVPASETGGYVLVLPKVGEFFCELGEILNGKRVPLLFDDYCIK